MPKYKKPYFHDNNGNISYNTKYKKIKTDKILRAIHDPNFN